MKFKNKIFLIALGAFLMINSAPAIAADSAVSPVVTSDDQGSESTQSGTASSGGTLSDSFMGAFGMNSDASGSTGEGGAGAQSSTSNSNAGALASGMTSASSSASNQVTGPFTPYSYQN